MRRSFALFVGISLAVVVACSSEKKPPAGVVVASTGGKAGSGGSSGRGSGGKGASGGSGARGGGGGTSGEDMGGASGSDDGGAGSGGADGGTNQGGTGGSPSAGTGGEAIAGRGGAEPEPCMAGREDPPPVPGVCEPGATWGDGEPVAVMADPGDPLVAITPDELTVLFMHITSVGEAMVADRADVGDDFGTPVTVGIDGVVGLSPDGLRVVVRAFDGTLGEATRPARGEAFGEPDEGAFALINMAALESEAALSSPVIAPDDRTLYYLSVPPGGTDYALHVSTRAGSGDWPVGTPVEACELSSFEGFNPAPTGVSSDGLTLFYWDSFYGTARAAYRETAGGPFVWVDELGPRFPAQPNAACDRLYYWEDGILYASAG